VNGAYNSLFSKYLTCGRNVGFRWVIRAGQPTQYQPAPAFNRPSAIVLWKTGFLMESFEKITDEGVEISVFFSELVDLPNRVNHSRMMLATKASSDLRQRGVGEGLAQVHGDLSRLGD
jgi:hypothetical protein